MPNEVDFALLTDAQLLEIFTDSLATRPGFAREVWPRLGYTNLRDLLMSNKYWNIESKRQSASNLSAANAVGGANKDFRIVGTAESTDWEAVRYIDLNYETANSVQGFTANFAPTANMTTPNVPTGSWTAFTWSGAGSVNRTNSAATAYPTAQVSDWMSSANIKNVARDDGGTLPMWMVTQHNPFGAGTYTYSFEGQGSTAFDTDILTSGRRYYKMFQSGVDGVGTPANFTQTAESNNCNPFILQFRTRGRVASLMVCGDSIAGGSLTTSNMLSPGFRCAIGLSSSNFPVQYLGSCSASRLSTSSLAEAKVMISNANPQIAAFEVFSPNDGAISASLVATQLRQAIDFVQHCRANDCVPILCTPTPDNTDTLASSNLKIGLTNSLLALRAKGVLICDWWNAVAAFPGNNASTGWGWITGYYGDDKHPSDAGAAIMAGILQLQVRKVINANGARVST